MLATGHVQEVIYLADIFNTAINAGLTIGFSNRTDFIIISDIDRF